MELATSLPPLTANLVTRDRRGAERIAINLQAELKAANDPIRPVTVAALSSTGFRLAEVGGLQPSQQVFLHPPGLAFVLAEVLWVDEHGDCGCWFPVPLTDPEMSTVLAAAWDA